jgi:hypothetical protein
MSDYSRLSRIYFRLVVMTFLFSGVGGILRAQTPARGDSIGAAPNTATNMVKPATIAQTNTPIVLRTNALGEFVLDFAILTSYPMQLPDNLISNTNKAAWADEQVNAMIPASIKGLDGKRVQIEGFMLPTTWDKAGKVSDFLLLANQISCCYGGPTQVHEFITIHVKEKAVDANMESTVPVKGVLHVGAVRENGQLVGIYRLETDAGFAVASSH